MAYYQYEIDSYQLYHMTDNAERSTVISCLKNGETKGVLSFYKEGIKVPNNTKGVNFDTIYLNFKEDRAANMLETLREEKPLYVWLDTNTQLGGLKTSSEPIGEGEIQPTV